MMWSIPALVKVLCVFALILGLNRVRFSLSVCLFTGAGLLGLWMNLRPDEVVQSALQSLTQAQTIILILLVGTILVISRLMKESRHLDRIVDGFAGLSGDCRAAGSVLPALIGLLPMPGGALFSAPMVQTALCRQTITGEQLTAINYWFRHIWEYWWPLYPGVVLAMALLEVDTWRFMAIMAPMTLVTALAGMIFLLRPIGKVVQYQRVISSSALRHFLWEIMPILIVVLVIVLLAGLAGLLNLTGIHVKPSGAVSILPGLLASFIWVGGVNHVSLRQLKAAILDRGLFSLLLLVAAIMVFKGIMIDSRAVVAIRNELMAYGIPVILVIAITPFLSGLITGIAIGFVGTSFPLIIPLFPTHSHFDFLCYAALAYTFGFMGMMLSPVHLCFLVTKDYFKSNLLGSYRLILLPSLTVMITAVILFLISRSL
jgi:integral membrane protein (TIGR00529 family)